MASTKVLMLIMDISEYNQLRWTEYKLYAHIYYEKKGFSVFNLYVAS